MSVVEALLSDLQNRDIQLWIENGTLRYRAPKDALNADLRAALRKHKHTIIEFLQEVQQEVEQAPQMMPHVPRVHPLPLSYAQQRIWFLEQLEGPSPIYNIPLSLHLNGKLDVTAFKAALQEIVQRHEVLRTTFPVADGVPHQQIAPNLSLPVPLTDLQSLPDSGQAAELQGLLAHEAWQPFDLRTGPLIRTNLYRLAETEYVFSLNLHHVIADGWSIGILMTELEVLYATFLNARPSPLPPLGHQYADFSIWQRDWLQGKRLAKQLAYWQTKLAGAPSLLALPTDYPRPPIQGFKGYQLPFALNSDLTAEVQEASREHGVSVFMILYTAFAVLLARYTGQEDLAIGTAIANRHYHELECLIGCFVNTLALRADLSGNPSFVALLERVQQLTLDAYAHQDIPFEQLVGELKIERNLSHNPLFQVMLTLDNTPTDRWQLADVAVAPLELESSIVTFDLTLALALEQDGQDSYLRGELEYNSELFDKATIQRLGRHLETVLAGMVAHPQRPFHALPLLTPAEQHQLLVEWNPPLPAAPPPLSVIQLLEAQVAATPHAIALVAGEHHLTYAALDAQVYILATALNAAGIGPESPVGVCTDRSPTLLVCLLAVLKAGGVYVPLDPTLPPERLRFLLSDARVQLVLTQPHLRATFPSTSVPLVCPDELSVPTPCPDSFPPPLPDQLAYLIYTSGSTGQPKGVAVPHGALAHHLPTAAAAYQLAPPDRVLQLAALSFDTALEQLLAPLLTGATVVLAEARLWAVTEFADKIARYGLSVIDLPPSYLHELVSTWADETVPFLHGHLRLLLVGGEALSPSTLRRWQQLAPVHTRLLNAYGPTETTIGATLFDLSHYRLDQAVQNIPIGRPLAGRSAYVLDAYGQLLPVGIPGELHLGGIGLARGYLNLAALTAEKFTPHPFSHQLGARLYKTGDLVRCLPDGNIEFLDRIDYQVKIRGYRIELGEIEAALKKYPLIKEAAVLAVNHSSTNGQALPSQGTIDTLDTLVQQLNSVDKTVAEQLLSEVTQASSPQEQLMDREYPEFRVSLQIKEGFVNPPRPSQRNWLLHRALDEFSADLRSLDTLAQRFVPGSERPDIHKQWQTSQAHYEASQLIIEGQQVMQTWERPLMEKMATIATETHGHVLEIGFGMGISATCIQDCGVQSHTIIEYNDDVIKAFMAWRKTYPNRDIWLIRGKWQEVLDQLEKYDSIFFDAYPLSEEEFVSDVIESVTFAESFFPVAASCLKDGGIFTYYSNEIDSFSRRHQRLLFKYFTSFTLSLIEPLSPPEDNHYWWADSMVAVKAVK